MSDHKKKHSSNDALDGNISGNKPEHSPATGPQTESLGQTDAEEMAKYGITRVPVDYYHWRRYRYTTLQDAIAQAKRTH